PTFDVYQGGKFAGIQQQLDYIKGLGAGAIWLSPVLKNLPWDVHSYHGYGIHDFLRADPNFAQDKTKADDELRALVDAAHAKGLYVIFDIVLNHTGDVFQYAGNPNPSFSPTPLPVAWRDALGDAIPAFTDVATIPGPSTDSIVWPAELQSNTYFRRQGPPQAGGNDTIGDFASLKQLRTDLPDVQRSLIRAFQYVIARYDIDGFRIDTLRYLQGGLALTFGNAVREYGLVLGKKNFFTFGEILDATSESDIAAIIGRNTLLSSDGGNSPVGVDAALDYPLFNTLVPVAKSSNPPTAVTDMYRIRKSKEQNVISSHGDATRYFVTFLDNHDMKHRFHFVQPGDEHRYDDQLTMALACLYCLPGIPCVYYGTEQGLHGQATPTQNNDAVVREALWGITPDFPQDAPFYVAMQQIATVRNAQPALRYGRFYFRPVSGDAFHFGISPFPGGILAWSRILNDEEVLIVANTNTSITQPVDVILEWVLSNNGQAVRILYSNKAKPTPPTAIRTLSPVQVTEVDGTVGTGPIHVTHVTLQPMEVQVLRVEQ
ncbi:MAG TPA: alpha-amylase family glycosyl hydrolase, partial [Puia sp.]|nr:alpha-amylase family glycosyl hydrolase [Puia sp.]